MVSMTKSGAFLFSLYQSSRAFFTNPTHHPFQTRVSQRRLRSSTPIIRESAATGRIVTLTTLFLWNNRFSTTTCATTPGYPTYHTARESQSSSSSSSQSTTPGPPPQQRRRRQSTKRNMILSTGYLNAEDAAALDVDLMSTPGFSLEQLMELAGLSVAEAVYQVLRPSPPTSSSSSGKKPKVLLVCGPGNNGGDGLVAARHLVLFGFDCTVVYPKQTKKEHFINLVHQCQQMEIEILSELPSDLTQYDGIVDAIFGFSFQGGSTGIREPFGTILNRIIQEVQQLSSSASKDNDNKATKKKVLIISVDVPSGWNVDEGDIAGTGFIPDVLVSLTAPKESARSFPGRHFIGGRFLPPRLAKQYQIQMPPYPGVSQVIEVTATTTTTTVSTTTTKDETDGSTQRWEAEYAAYLEEKYRNEKAAEAARMEDVPSQGPSHPKKVSEAIEDSWEYQYAEYCREKEAKLAEEDARRLREMEEQRKSSS